MKIYWIEHNFLKLSAFILARRPISIGEAALSLRSLEKWGYNGM